MNYYITGLCSPTSLARCEVRIVLFTLLKRISLRYIEKVVVVSPSNRVFLLSLFGQDLSHKVLTISNGIAFEDFERALPADIPQRKPGRDLVVTVVAGLNNQKGHEYLIRAIPAIKRRIHNVKFLLPATVICGFT